MSLDEEGSYDIDLGPAESMLIVFDRHRGATEKAHVASSQTIIDLSAHWDVELDHALLDTVIKTHFDTLFDLKNHPDYQNFAGTIVYKRNVNCRDGAGTISTDNPTILDLGLVEGVSEVFVNGQSAGVKYYGRRKYDIRDFLHEGDNDLEIRVTTTLGNYLKTFSREENPVAWIYVNHPRRDQSLQPMGLIGPVKIIL